MKRQIFEVHKKVLGASVGGYVPMASGYPKVFDSHAAAYADKVIGEIPDLPDEDS